MSTHRPSRVQRIVLAAALAAAVSAPAGSAARSATAAQLCVGAHAGCFSSVQAALEAAHDGDTIQVGPGTFAGGIQITKSVRLVGVSAAATIIHGGGPVITIGRFDGDNGGLTVALSRLSITGGFNDSQPSTSVVAGGGVSIPAGSPGNVPGATVSIDHSIVSGNRVTARDTIPQGGFSCSSTNERPCAFVTGGGIDNSGALTLTDTVVADNVSGAGPGGTSPASDARGGGIDNHPQGTLTLHGCRVTGNRAAVSPPNGSFVEAGGILDSGALVMDAGAVDHNAAVVVSSLRSSFPSDVQQEADAGGLDVSETGMATVSHSTISDNSVSDFDGNGDAQAINGGIDDDGSLVLTDSAVERNTVTATVPAGSGFLAGAVSGGLHVGGSATVRRSSISGNTVRAVSDGGVANAAGAGIGNLSGRLTLEQTLVGRNRGTAIGNGGLVLGGGILNIGFGGPAPELALTGSAVTGNRLAGVGPGFAPQGGGIYSTDPFSADPLDPKNFFPVTLVHSVIAGNSPDQCVGGC